MEAPGYEGMKRVCASHGEAGDRGGGRTWTGVSQTALRQIRSPPPLPLLLFSLPAVASSFVGVAQLLALDMGRRGKTPGAGLGDYHRPAPVVGSSEGYALGHVGCRALKRLGYDIID
jgi:hypothetical protein